MEFIEPPPSKKGAMSDRWINVVAELKTKKDQWALVGNYSPGVATHLRRGKYPAFMGDFSNFDPAQAALYMQRHWEITTRKTHNGDRNDVYIRWVG